MMESGTPRDIRPDPRFLDIHAPTPKVLLDLSPKSLRILGENRKR
jgi:hypothetical protein